MALQVYGDPLEHPQKEEYWGNVNCIGERSCYDEGKRAAETLTFDYLREHNMPVCGRHDLLDQIWIPQCLVVKSTQNPDNIHPRHRLKKAIKF